jgi:hypothetical protein
MHFNALVPTNFHKSFHIVHHSRNILENFAIRIVRASGGCISRGKSLGLPCLLMCGHSILAGAHNKSVVPYLLYGLVWRLKMEVIAACRS